MGVDDALNVEELRGRFLEHSRQAYRLLPPLEKLRILDIGCGRGQQTMELPSRTIRIEPIADLPRAKV